MTEEKQPAGESLRSIVMHSTPSIYFNGFAVNSGQTDITILLMNGQRVVGTIQSHPSVLKELARRLSEGVEALETSTGMQYKPLSELLPQESIDHDD